MNRVVKDGQGGLGGMGELGKLGKLGEFYELWNSMNTWSQQEELHEYSANQLYECKLVKRDCKILKLW